MIRFLTSSDEHLADRAPGFRKDDYRSSIMKMLEWQGEFGKRSNITALLRAGDFFHVKAANKTTHATVSQAIKIHSSYQFPTYAISGNHDMSNNNINSLIKQPIGVMYESNIFRNIKDDVFTDNNISVRLIGIDFVPGIDADYVRNIIQIPREKTTYTISLVHALSAFSPEEKLQKFFNENIIDYRDLIFPGCPDVYVFGHYHKDQGITKIDNTYFINLGSISRGSLTFENIERKPKSSLITFTKENISCEEIIIPHEDPNDIFDFSLKEKLDREIRSLDDFVETLRSSSFTSDGSLDQRKLELNKFPSDLRERVLSYIEAAENDFIDS